MERGLFSKINPWYRREIVLTQAEFNLFLKVPTSIKDLLKVLQKYLIKGCQRVLVNRLLLMSQQLLFEPVPCDKFDLINKEELITLYKGIEKINKHLQSEVTRLIKETKNLNRKISSFQRSS